MVLHYLRIDVFSLVEKAIVDLIEMRAYHLKVLVKLDVPSGPSHAFLGALVPVCRENLPSNCELGLLSFSSEPHI